MVNKEMIKVKPNTYDRLEKRRGFNGCVTFDDVINYVLDQEEENNSKERRKLLGVVKK